MCFYELDKFVTIQEFFILKEIILFGKNAFYSSKVTVNTFLMSQKISVLLNFLFEESLWNVSVSTKILSTEKFFNTENKNVSWAPNRIRMVSEASCNTED